MDKREYMFMESFFRGQSILDGLSLAANDLGETTSDMRVYLMSLPSNPVTVQGQYLAGCRYKAMHDVGMSYAKIAQKVARHEERVRRYIKVVETFKPCEIYPDLKITHYINATFEKDPKKYILEQRYIRKGAFSLSEINTLKKECFPVKERFIKQAVIANRICEAGGSITDVSIILNASYSYASTMIRAGLLPIEVMRQAKSITEIQKAIKQPDPVFYLTRLQGPREKLKIDPKPAKNVPQISNQTEKNTEEYLEGYSVEQLKAFSFGILNILAANTKLKNDYTAQLNASKGMAGIVKGYKTDLQAAREYIVQIEQENERLKKELKIRREFMEEYNNLRAQVSVELNQIN